VADLKSFHAIFFLFSPHSRQTVGYIVDGIRPDTQTHRHTHTQTHTHTIMNILCWTYKITNPHQV